MKEFIETVTNIECFMNLIDESYLLNNLFKINVSKMPTSMNVRDIGNAHHECNIYSILNVYLNETIKKTKFVRKQLTKEFHIVKDLKCKILIEMNILKTKQINIDMINKIMMIFTCKNLIVDIRIALKFNARIKRIIHFKNQNHNFVQIDHQGIHISEKKKLSENRDYLFESNASELTVALGKTDDFYIHVCDCNIFVIQIKNDQPISIIFNRRVRLRTLTEYKKKML